MNEEVTELRAVELYDYRSNLPKLVRYNFIVQVNAIYYGVVFSMTLCRSIIE